MSDERSATDHRASPETHRSPDPARRGSFVRGTIRFFAPSLIVGLVAPFVFPAIRRAAKPLAKGLVKGALTFAETVKEGAAEAQEQIVDLLAEVNAEREQEAAVAHAAATMDPGAPNPALNT